MMCACARCDLRAQRCTLMLNSEELTRVGPRDVWLDWGAGWQSFDVTVYRAFWCVAMVVAHSFNRPPHFWSVLVRGMCSYMTQCIHELVFKSQHPLKTVDLIFD